MDQDLGGDVVKLVGYMILFTKRDAEAVLQAEREEIVDYSTNEASFAGLKVAEFLERVERHGIPWPSAWQVPPGDGYSPAGRPIRRIPEDDRRFLSVHVTVTSRWPRAEAGFDKDQADMLRRIREVDTE